jgi:hypothetical protein
MYNQNDYANEDKMGKTCREIKGNAYRYWWESQKEREQWKNQGTDG